MKSKMLGLLSIIALTVRAADTNDFPVLYLSTGPLSNAYVSTYNVTFAWIYSRQGGGGKFKLSDLPPEVQARCHYDANADAALGQKALDAAHAKVESERSKIYRMIDNEPVLITSLTKLDGQIEQILKVEGGIMLRLYRFFVIPNAGGGSGTYRGPVGESKSLFEKSFFLSRDV